MLFKGKKSDRGASLVEMGMLVALLAMVTVGAVTSMGGASHDTFARAGCFIGASDGGGSNSTMGCEDTTQPTSFNYPTPVPTSTH